MNGSEMTAICSGIVSGYVLSAGITAIRRGDKSGYYKIALSVSIMALGVLGAISLEKR